MRNVAPPNAIMPENALELVKSAIEEKRQDDAALALYWDCIQSQEQRELAPEAYCLLYSAFYEPRRQQDLDALIDTACQHRFTDVDVLAFLAEGEFQAERYENALKLYDRLFTLKGLDETGFQHLKLACFKRRPFDDFANLLLQRCLKDRPDDESIIQFLYSQYLLNDHFTHTGNATAIYQRVLQDEPTNLAARTALCECYFRHGKHDLAMAEAEAGLACEHQHPDLLSVLAKIYNERGEYGRVVGLCRDVLAKRPGRVDMQILLAEVYARNALTTSEAIRSYQTALRCDPHHVIVQLALFRSYMRKLQLDDALEQTRQIVSSLYEQHGAGKREFQLTVKEILSEYERVMRRIPDDLSLHLITAKLYEYIGHFHTALICYRRILEFPLDTAMTHKMIELLEKLATFRIQNPHLFLYLGLLYHKIGQREEAKQAFRTVMYSELDEHEIEDLLVRHDRSIWQYPAVLVILAHHRIVTRDVLEGLLQTFRQPDRDDWKGVLWVLRELYDIDELLPELRQLVTLDCFDEIYQHIIPLFAYNGSNYAIQTLHELLLHEQEPIRQEALNVLFQMDDRLAEQMLVTMSRESLHADIRLEIAGFFSQQPSEQATAALMNMVRDVNPKIRLYVVQSLQKRDLPSPNFREALFTEEEPEVKVELIKLIAGLHAPEEWAYLVHLLNEATARRHQERAGGGNVYARLKKFVSQPDSSDEIHLFSALIHAIGTLRLEDGVNSLARLAEQDRSPLLRIEAIEAIGQIGSIQGISALRRLLGNASEPQDIRAAAEEALDLLLNKKI